MKRLRIYQALWVFAVCLVVISSLISGAEHHTQVPPARGEMAQHWDRHSRSRSRYHAHRFSPGDAPRDHRPQHQTLAQTFTPLRPLVTAIQGTPNHFTWPGVLCKEFVSREQEYAPIQVVDTGIPEGGKQLTWVLPTESQYIAPFSGIPGTPAGHEGIDYVHADPKVETVAVVAAAPGRVAYVRNGCPQSTRFGPNRQRRECGAGWGNHVIVDHGQGLFTRYAHLAPRIIPVRVGDSVAAGDPLGEMGNTGRSDTRHLHFEVGVTAADLNACASAQSFDRVLDPAALGTWLATGQPPPSPSDTTTALDTALDASYTTANLAY